MIHFNCIFESIKEERQKTMWIIGFALSFMISAIAHSGIVGEALLHTRAVQQSIDMQELTLEMIENPKELIRFHVLANSDSEEDQALKRAVRDAILKEVSPRLASSKSLEESRKILIGLRPEMEAISQQVIAQWGKDYEVSTDYGDFIFPTKSYGSLVLPAGEYEAVRVLIGKAEGSNWWCVLFPPLCFVDIEHSTAVAVDGKPGIPLDETKVDETENGGIQGSTIDNREDAADDKETEKPRIRFWFLEMLSNILK